MTEDKKKAKQERIGVYICHCGTNIAGTMIVVLNAEGRLILYTDPTAQ